MKKLNSTSRFGPGVRASCARMGRHADLSATGSSDKSVYIFGKCGGEEKARFSDHPTAVESVGFDKSDACLVAGCSGGSVWLWDIEKESQITSLPGHRSNCSVVEFHPFGSFFASGSCDTNVKIWDQRQSRCVQTYRNHHAEVRAIRFSPHGRWLLSGDEEGIIKVWDLSTGKELASLESHSGGVSDLDFHPTDFFLVSGSSDKTVKLWNCDSGFALAATSEHQLEAVKKSKFSADGKSLYLASDQCVKLFSLDSHQRRIACVHTESVAFGNVMDLLPSSDGELYAISTDGDALSSWSTSLDLFKSVQQPRSIRERVKSARKTVDDAIFATIEAKENNSTNISTPTMVRGAGIIQILENRFTCATSVSSLWLSGNSRSSIEEASKDIFTFISLLAILPFERTRTALSVDSCAKILSNIIGFGLLTSSTDQFAETFRSLPFSVSFDPKHSSAFLVSTGLNCAVFLAKRFGPILSELRRASTLPCTPGTDVTREERIAKAFACLELFENVADILSRDAQSCKLLRREKQDANTQILSLIQP